MLYEVITEIKAIVKSVEPEVEVEELSLRYKKLNVKLEGLNCANCAAKIEEKVKNLNEVYKGAYNFSNGLFSLEIEKWVDQEEFIKKIQGIVDQMEPGVIASIKDGHKIEKELTYAEEFSKKELTMAISGVIIFVITSYSIHYTKLYEDARQD